MTISGVTFVGGKWYDAHGKEVPRPQATGVRFGQDGRVLSVVQLEPRMTPDAVLERLANCTCAQPQRTGHVPGCAHFADALYGCERANAATIAQLAKLADTTISDLERRRIDYAAVDSPALNGPKSQCPDLLPDAGRRRCVQCPYWDRHGVTPFDYQKVGER